MSNPYSRPEYARAVTHLGVPRELHRSGGTVLLRAIEHAPEPMLDAVGPYPVFACRDWDRLGDDLAELARDGVVTTVAVVDPFGGWDEHQLRAAFERARPWKAHYVVDLAAGAHAGTNKDHLRKARRAARNGVEVVPAADPRQTFDTWVSLYRGLRDKHGFDGAADFPDAELAALLAHPDLRAFTAVRDGRAVAMSLWLCGPEVAYYHLGASSPEGYALGASFALFARILEELAADGLAHVDLGGAAGLDADADDGLARFKRGWSTGTRPAWLCGTIGNSAAYEALCRDARRDPADTSYFPAYRAPAP